MGRELIEKMLPALEKMDWPTTAQATGLGRKSFDVGIEQLTSYQGDPNDLMKALLTFKSGDSQPFCFAGVAFTLILASQESDGSYDEHGLEQAMLWLEKAQASEPEIIAINVIEALIYINIGRLDDARIVLDYLSQLDPHDYYVHLAEISYWQQVGEAEQVIDWFTRSMDAAKTIPQRLRLRTQLGDYYAELSRFNEAVTYYKEAVHLNKQSPVVWHKLAVTYWRMEEFEECERCNQMTLRLGDFSAARKLEAAIKQQKSESGARSRLFGRNRP